MKTIQNIFLSLKIEKNAILIFQTLMICINTKSTPWIETTLTYSYFKLITHTQCRIEWVKYKHQFFFFCTNQCPSAFKVNLPSKECTQPTLHSNDSPL